MLAGGHSILGLRITKRFIKLIWPDMDFFTWEIWIEFNAFLAGVFFETGIMGTVSKESIESTFQTAGNTNKYRLC